MEIGEYVYPTLGTFKNAMDIAKEALEKFGGIIPSLDAANILGYQIKNPNAISGYIYKRFDDLCMFGLFTRERGGLKTTDLAEKALHPSDRILASDGKAEAIRNIPIIAKTFKTWDGEIPEDTAFPVKIGEISGISWKDAKKHTEMLKKLFNETFPYLKPSATYHSPIDRKEADRGEKKGMAPVTEVPTTPSKPYGELRTTLGSIVIKDQKTAELAKKLVDLLFEQKTEEQKEKQK